MRTRQSALALMALLQLAAPVHGQEPNPPTGTPAGDHLDVYLVTYGPGDRVWEPFGHNAIWIRDRRTGTDLAYNWGVFSFNEVDFVPRFLKGTMMYRMAASDAHATARGYESLNRSVHVQELALTGSQKVDLERRVRANLEDPVYRYDYFLDNCSTRVRDMLNAVLGGAIETATTNVADETFRFHTRRLTQHDLAIWTGIDLLLGNPGSRPISRWESLFVPMELQEVVGELEIAVPGGGRMPLVASEEVVFEAVRSAEPETPTGIRWQLPLFGLALGGLLVWLARGWKRGSGGARLALGLTAAAWCLLAGIIGVVLVLVWFTDHVWMYWNENLLQFSPLSLVLLAFLPGALRGSGQRAARWAAVVAGLAVLGFVIQVFPGVDQGNGELIAAALPVHLGLAWALSRAPGRHV